MSRMSDIKASRMANSPPTITDFLCNCASGFLSLHQGKLQKVSYDTFREKKDFLPCCCCCRGVIGDGDAASFYVGVSVVVVSVVVVIVKLVVWCFCCKCWSWCWN